MSIQIPNILLKLKKNIKNCSIIFLNDSRLNLHGINSKLILQQIRMVEKCANTTKFHDNNFICLVGYRISCNDIVVRKLSTIKPHHINYKYCYRKNNTVRVLISRNTGVFRYISLKIPSILSACY